ncbi:hypothetical protein B0H13DRAFT_1872280 [Mycena leptocephala]|nr:hypothetical protein B0H13DRAFT_1872280 [Mycena leptocephala]
MHFAKLVLLSTSLAPQACAGPSFPKVTAGAFKLIQATTAVPGRLSTNADFPTGDFADLGWIFASVGDDTEPFVYDGFAKNITVLYTSPGGVEHIESGPGIGGGDGFCGFFPGFWIEGVLDSSVLGTYTGRWIAEFGESTQPYATEMVSGISRLLSRVITPR